MWVGTGLTILGVITTGVGLMTRLVSMAVVGPVAMLVGVVTAWRAGVLVDTRTRDSTAREEVEDVRRGRVRHGTVAGDMLSASAAQAESRAADRRLRELLDRSHRAPGPPLAHGAAVVMLLVCVVLVWAQWGLYPPGHTAQENALRTAAVAVVLGLCGLRILAAHRPRRVAASLAVLAGVMLALFGPMAPHQQAGVAWTETALGTIIVLAALTALASPLREDHHATTNNADPPGAGARP